MAHQATKANSLGLPKGTEGVNVGGHVYVFVHVERGAREKELMADIWHRSPPSESYSPAPYCHAE